jgi:hypothetical protein
MNHPKIILISAIVMMGLSSCVNEEVPAYENGSGKMQLEVDVLKPKSTRATVDTKDFPVTLLNAEGNPLGGHKYNKVSEVPKQIQLPVGQYAAVSHSPFEFEKIMDKPYYKGIEDFYIRKDMNTKVEVTCRMANGSFEVKFSDTFHEVFKAWNIMINDGTETAIAYSATDVLPLPKRYMRFEDKTSEIFVNFVGVTNEGSRITMSNTLTKEQASEQYDDDNPNFSGGDAIVLNFTPVESTEGDITGITLKADIQFEESEITYPLEVEEKGTNGEEEGGDNPGEGGDTPGGENSGDENAITLNLPKDMTVSVSTDPALGDTYIASEHGLKSIKVKMSSTSDEMISSLQDLSRNYNGVDFINGAEVVGNDEMIRLFSDLGQTLAIPSQGDKEYTFPIGNFFTLLAFLPGEHTFTLTITDMQGNTKDGLLKLAVE